MEREEALKRVVGKADLCELLSCAFSYPDIRTAEALVEGTLADDAQACIDDAALGIKTNAETVDALRAWSQEPIDEVLTGMRRVYTKLYLSPGGNAPVFPYESAFLHVECGAEGVPALFRTPVTLDVEHCMREAGVIAKNGRKEPCDSVYEEFEFLSYLYAEQAETLRIGDDDEAIRRESQAEAFLDKHVMKWMPRFMERTHELADGPYAALASFALASLAILSQGE